MKLATMGVRSALPVLFVLLLSTPAYPQSVHVEPRDPSNLLVCSWNIKWFRDTGRDFTRLAQVISNFDICGIVELQSDRVLQDLATTLEAQTGEPWMYIQSDRTGLGTGYFEQFGFIWREGKVRLVSGHIGNVADLDRTHRHQPYLATFRSGNFDFRFMIIHTRWTTATQRREEVAQIARDFHWFQNRTTERDVVLAGDFNYPEGSSRMEPITTLPGVVNLIPPGTLTTLRGTGQGFRSSYDHIFVHQTHTQEATDNGGAYDFVAGLGYTDTQAAKRDLSDHLPVWAEFRIDGPDDD